MHLPFHCSQRNRNPSGMKMKKRFKRPATDCSSVSARSVCKTSAITSGGDATADHDLCALALHPAANLSACLRADLKQLVATELGAVARPSDIHFVSALPKTRSGKLLRRALQALAEGRDPGDLSTLENPAAMVEVAESLQKEAVDPEHLVR